MLGLGLGLGFTNQGVGDQDPLLQDVDLAAAFYFDDPSTHTYSSGVKVSAVAAKAGSGSFTQSTADDQFDYDSANNGIKSVASSSHMDHTLGATTSVEGRSFLMVITTPADMDVKNIVGYANHGGGMDDNMRMLVRNNSSKTDFNWRKNSAGSEVDVYTAATNGGTFVVGGRYTDDTKMELFIDAFANELDFAPDGSQDLREQYVIGHETFSPANAIYHRFYEFSAILSDEKMTEYLTYLDGEF